MDISTLVKQSLGKCYHALAWEEQSYSFQTFYGAKTAQNTFY